MNIVIDSKSKPTVRVRDVVPMPGQAGRWLVRLEASSPPEPKAEAATEPAKPAEAAPAATNAPEGLSSRELGAARREIREERRRRRAETEGKAKRTRSEKSPETKKPE